jgi:hypothetical protein
VFQKTIGFNTDIHSQILRHFLLILPTRLWSQNIS